MKKTKKTSTHEYYSDGLLSDALYLAIADIESGTWGDDSNIAFAVANWHDDGWHVYVHGQEPFDVELDGLRNKVEQAMTGIENIESEIRRELEELPAPRPL